MAEIKEAGIKILSIEEIAFSFKKMPQTFVEKFSPDKCFINFQVRFKHNLEADEFVIGCDIQYTYDNDPDILLNFVSESTFQITPLKAVLEVVSPLEFRLPEYIMVPILSTSIGTTRGMLITRTAGTYLSKVMLPILDISEFVRNIRPTNAPEHQAK